MSDIVAPGWRPTYTGDRSLGWVGSGGELGANLFYLYRAGRNEVPAVACVYAELAVLVHRVAATLEHLFTVPGRAPHPAHQRILELRDEAHDVFRQTALRLQEVGQALVTTAARYAAADEAAAAEFCRWLDDYAGEFSAPAPVMLPPPAVGEVPPSRHPEGGAGRAV